jgi:hypothetical protein
MQAAKVSHIDVKCRTDAVALVAMAPEAGMANCSAMSRI